MCLVPSNFFDQPFVQGAENGGSVFVIYLPFFVFLANDLIHFYCLEGVKSENT